MSQSIKTMSYEYINNLRKSDIHTSKNTYGNKSVSTMKWSLPLGIKFLNAIGSQKCNFRTAYYPTLSVDEYSFIFPFLCALDAYIENGRNKISAAEIIRGTCLEGPNFAAFLKKVKRKSIMKTFKAIPVEIDTSLDHIPSYTFSDIGEIFNYAYLPFWIEPEPEDYLEGSISTHISKEHIDEYKRILLELLPEKNTFDLIDPKEVLLTMSGSSTYHKAYKKNYMSKNNKRPFFASKLGRVKRSVIRVGPANTRDSILTNPNSLLTIQYLDRQLLKILEKMKNHIHLTNESRIFKRFKKFFDDSSFYVMRDIKKEGITKPWEIIKASLEVLYEKYELDCFKFTDFFENYELELKDGSIFYPKRGHGLGMGNALTTIMQVTLFCIMQNRVDIEGLSFDGACLALNDDYVARLDSEEDVDIYLDIEDQVCKDFCIAREPKKSFYCRGSFVLAEIYFPKEHNIKESYVRRNILNAFSCVNITHAKQYINSLIKTENVDIFESYKEEIIAYFGYEFFPEEMNYPTIFGGWVSSTLEGVSLDLLELEELPYNNKICRAYNACKINSLKYSRRSKNDDKNFYGPVHTLYPSVNLGDKELDFDTGSIRDLRLKYQRYDDDEMINFAYRRLYERRQEMFKKTCSTPYNIFIETVIKDYPVKTFYPIPMMIKKTHRYNFQEGSIRDIYLSPNPKLSYLAWMNPNLQLDVIPEAYSIEYVNRENLNPRQSTELRSQLKRSIIPNIRKNLVFELEIAYPIEAKKSLLKSYLDVLGITRVSTLMSNNGEIPIIYSRYRSPLIKRKKEIYGHLFTFEQIEAFSKFSREQIYNFARKVKTEDLNLSIRILEEIALEEEARKEVIKEPDPEYDESEMEFYKEKLLPSLKEIDEKIVFKLKFNEYENLEYDVNASLSNPDYEFRDDDYCKLVREIQAQILNIKFNRDAELLSFDRSNLRVFDLDKEIQSGINLILLDNPNLENQRDILTSIFNSNLSEAEEVDLNLDDGDG
jgi:hypothetical protein